MNDKMPFNDPELPFLEKFAKKLLRNKAGEDSGALFDIDQSINPLVAAALPLLTIATQLREQPQSPELNFLHASLCQEVKAFEKKAKEANYRSPFILAARYFLCVFIDEVILTTSWGKHSVWQTEHLLNAFQGESFGGERFFTILERSALDHHQNIDLLELGYLCLSLGYEGIYKGKANGEQERARLLDRLYGLIRDTRGDFSKQLLIAPVPKIKKSRSRWSWPPIWVTSVITIAILIGIYLPFHTKLSHFMMPLKQSLQAMLPNQPSDNSP